jgi:hypothetical protein
MVALLWLRRRLVMQVRRDSVVADCLLGLV